MAQPVQIETISLGENNAGSFGPDGLSEEQRAAIHRANGSGDYIKPATRRWICLDGRLVQADWQGAASENAEADPQTAGGIAITETAAEFMLNDAPAPLSQVVAAKTREAVADDIDVTVHGDDHAGKEGCAANKLMRDVLRYTAANSDIISPLAWNVMERLAARGAFGTEDLQLITPADIVALATQAQASAEDDELWDVTPTQVADIILENGGTYLELAHGHAEKNVVVLIGDGAFDKVGFVRDFSTDGSAIEQFAVSMGEYAKVTLDRGEKHGQPFRDNLLKIAAAALYNLAADKALSSQEMELDLIS